jgi:hypothetical protein
VDTPGSRCRGWFLVILLLTFPGASRPQCAM